MDEFLTVQEVAAQLRVSKMTIYRLCQDGSMPVLKVGSSYRIPKSGFDQWLTTHSEKEN